VQQYAVQQYIEPGEVDVLLDDNVVALLFARARVEPRRPVLAHRDGDRFVDVSGADVV
jgi:hypothetical protein